MSSNNWHNTRNIKTTIYDELGLHSLTKRRWCSKLIFFYKIVNGLLPNYLYSYLHFSSKEIYPLRSAASSKLRQFSSRTISFKNTFFPYCINEWNNLKADIRNAKSLNIFKKEKSFIFSLRSTRCKTSYTSKT